MALQSINFDAVARGRARPGVSCRRAFTMVELLVSIGLVVVLILGINAVFKYSTDAVGTGQALTSAIREGRAVQAVFAKDLAAYVPNGSGSTESACTIITSYAMPMFRDRRDEAGDKGVGNTLNVPRQLSRDLDGNGVEGEANVAGEVISPVVYNGRNHRLDCLSFFARDLFPRQTGNDGFYVADMRSQEAFIWYGHLWLPDNTQPPAGPKWPTNTLPGASNSASLNPNNYYSSQIVLGRVAMLLVQPDISGGTPGIIRQDPNNALSLQQKFIAGDSVVLPGGSMAPLIGFDTNNLAGSSRSDDGKFFIGQSRYDLAGTTIDQYRQNVSNFISSGGTNWWAFLTYNFQCEPFLIRQPNAQGQIPPITSENAARTHPYFVKGASQFIVEFAGDFMQQNLDASDVDGRVALWAGTAAAPGEADGTYGDVLSLNPDGVVDFVVDKSVDAGFISAIGNNTNANPSLWRRKVRWYGMPRDENGDGIVQGFRNGVGAHRLVDVVPARDVARTCIYNNLIAFAGFPWEHFTALGNPGGPNTMPIAGGTGDYANINSGLQPGNAGTPLTPTYIAAFGPNDPRVRMIRITVTIEDTNGRLAEGLTTQYVFALP